MSRYRNYASNDDEARIFGDSRFLGVNEKLSRELLTPGIAAKAINKRMRDGAAATRNGTIMPVWHNLPDYAEILGSGIYSNPNGAEVILLATTNGLYQLVDNGAAPGLIGIPTTESLTTPVEFVQAFDKVVMFRGLDHAPLQWDGISTSVGFKALATPTDTTKDTIANADTGEVFKSRLLVPSGRDDVLVSDILNYTQYDPILENWRINQGRADRLVRIYPYGNAGVVMFKETSILLLSNFTDAAHPEDATLNPINDSLGLAARKSVVQAGADALFLSHSGIFRIHQVLQDRTETAPIPVSDRIQPVIERINWRFAGGIVSAVLGELAFWAVPLDRSEVNNAMLVYNLATENWETSYDEYAGAISINALHVTLHQGVRRLFAIDYTARAIYVMHEGETDLLASGEHQISDLLETRGYGAEGSDDLLNVRRAKVSIATWNPEVEITAITDGAFEELVVTPEERVTRDPLKYFVFGQSDYDPTNDNDDHSAPRREDYSVTVEDDPGWDPNDTGIAFDIEQESIVPVVIDLPCRWVSLRVDNFQGTCTVRGVATESRVSEREMQTAA